MADGDAPAPADGVGQLADLVDVEMLEAGADIEMDIDIGVVFLRQLEDAVDLRRPVAIVAGRAADGPRAIVHAGDQVDVGLGHAAPAFLDEHAQIQIDRPGIVLRQLLQRLEAFHADIGVDLDMGAHMGDAVDQQGFQRGFGARVDVLDGEAGLDRRDPLHVVAAAVGRRRAAVQNARLVEMDMGFDQPGRDQAALGVEFLAVGRQPRLDGGDTAVGDGDIARRCVRRGTGDARVTYDQIERHVVSPVMFTALWPAAVQYPSAQPSFLGSDPPIKTPRSQSIQIA